MGDLLYGMDFFGVYQRPRTCCISRLVTVIPIQQQAPKARGAPPVFTSLTISVLRPMAAMARTMKNLLRVLMGRRHWHPPQGTRPMVVIRLARDEVEDEKGEDGAEFYLCPLSFCPRFACRKARTKTMGMMARVRVSFYGNGFVQGGAAQPPHLSHVEAAAVTEEVSFTAVPAKMPNPSPDVVLQA